MIRYSDQPLDGVGATLLVNPVNCVGVMGAGVAKWFAQRYPTMLRAYQDVCRYASLAPGRLFVWELETHAVVNFPTKDHWRDRSRFDDVEWGLMTLSRQLDRYETRRGFDPTRIAMPEIGCGLGGLDWATVEPAVKWYLGRFDVVVCYGRLVERGPCAEVEQHWDVWN